MRDVQKVFHSTFVTPEKQGWEFLSVIKHSINLLYQEAGNVFPAAAKKETVSSRMEL